jgi:hypothetical protein
MTTFVGSSDAMVISHLYKLQTLYYELFVDIELVDLVDYYFLNFLFIMYKYSGKKGGGEGRRDRMVVGFLLLPTGIYYML